MQKPDDEKQIDNPQEPYGGEILCDEPSFIVAAPSAMWAEPGRYMYHSLTSAHVYSNVSNVYRISRCNQ